MGSPVADPPAAPSEQAEAHFASKLRFETDCSDVYAAFENAPVDFVLLDVRSPDLFAAGHVPGAINLPQRKIIKSKMARWPDDTLFVVYCAGPHCNGADRAAIALARLGRPVKLMIGGVTGWLDEGYAIARAGDSALSASSFSAATFTPPRSTLVPNARDRQPS